MVVTQLLLNYLIKPILKDFNQTYTTFPLLSEDGVRKMLIVVAVTSSHLPGEEAVEEALEIKYLPETII